MVLITNPRQFQFYLIAVAIFKNEAPYLAEWIEYHLSVGIEKFFLYDNDSEDEPESVLCSYILEGTVNYTRWPGIGQQLPVYNFALSELRWSSFWIAFFDVDEFIVPAPNFTIPDVLWHFVGEGCLQIYWIVYGSGGQVNRTSGLVMERFVDHAPLTHLWSHIVKSIVNPRAIREMDVHEPDYTWRQKMRGRDCHGTRYSKPLWWAKRNAVHDCIHINHYWTKSFEEWMEKRERGRAPGTMKRDVSAYEEFGYWFGNNDTLMDRHIRVVKERLTKRMSGMPTPCAHRLWLSSPDKKRD
jgi:hypothetical protein